MYKLELAKQARKDIQNVDRAGLREHVSKMLVTMERNPHAPEDGFEKLVGRKNTYSRRIDYTNRLIYIISPNTNGLKAPDGQPYDGIIRVVSMWGHAY